MVPAAYSIRPTVLGKKSFLFIGHPDEYLRDIFERLPGRGVPRSNHSCHRNGPKPVASPRPPAEFFRFSRGSLTASVVRQVALPLTDTVERASDGLVSICEPNLGDGCATKSGHCWVAWWASKADTVRLSTI